MIQHVITETRHKDLPEASMAMVCADIARLDRPALGEDILVVAFIVLGLIIIGDDDSASALLSTFTRAFQS